jgi:hypothetical protein
MRPSKWLVFIRPFLAGFNRPLTEIRNEFICHNDSIMSHLAVRKQLKNPTDSVGQYAFDLGLVSG